MGYTHYWYVRLDAPQDQIVQAHLDIAKIIEATKVPLADGMGTEGTDPVVEEGRILFNGVEDDAHETFVWPPSKELPKWREGEVESFDFCKTARKPYDQTVAACLLAAKRALGDNIRVSSDGGLDEFLRGMHVDSPESSYDLFVRVFDEEPPVPFTEEDEE